MSDFCSVRGIHVFFFVVVKFVNALLSLYDHRNIYSRQKSISFVSQTSCIELYTTYKQQKQNILR